MAITSYAELQTAVGNWLHRADLTTIIPDLIMLGEKRIFREVRVKDMETALSVAISSGVAALPSDYLDLKFAYIDGNPTSVLQRTSAHQIYSEYPLRASSSRPLKVAREGSNFIFGPYPDSSYTVKGIYYAEPTSIATTANTLFTNNPDLCLFASLLEAAPYIGNDERTALWGAKYEQVKQLMHQKDADEYSSGGGMAVVAA